MVDIKNSKNSLSIELWLIIGYVALRFIFPMLIARSFSAQSEWIIFGFEAITYGLICFLIWRERNDLINFNIDRSVLTIVLVGIIFRTSTSRTNVLIILELAFLLVALLIIIVLRKGKLNIPKNRNADYRWIIGSFLIGILLSLFFTIPVMVNNNEGCLAAKPDFVSLVATLISNILNELSHASIPEEILFRGFLWGYLRKIHWQEKSILLLQALLFWLIHINLLNHPYSFWMTIPVSTMVLSILVYYSHSVITSIVSHTILNAMIPVVSFIVLPFVCNF